MSNLIQGSVFFGVVISLLAYAFGSFLRKKLKLAVLNPLLIAIILIIIILGIFHISYKKYYASAKYLSYLLTPATVALAIPLYEQLQVLKDHWKAILASILAGVFTSMFSILLMADLFGFTHKEYVTMLPKSITTAIGMSLSKQMGGQVTITVAVIIITGVFGSILAELAFRIFRIHHPVAKGLAMGTAAHAIGTAKAMELGELEGAMASLSIAVAGLITVLTASIFSNFR